MSCKVTAKPEFIKVNSLDIVEMSTKSIIIQANLKFKNKNSVGGTLQANDIHVFVDQVDVATINSTEFKVPRKQEFIIPLKVTIQYDKIYKDGKQNILNNILNVIAAKKIDVSYKGIVRYKLSNFQYDYKIDHIQEINIKK